jgi:hypothetical protein
MAAMPHYAPDNPVLCGLNRRGERAGSVWLNRGAVTVPLRLHGVDRPPLGLRGAGEDEMLLADLHERRRPLLKRVQRAGHPLKLTAIHARCRGACG